MDKDKVTQETCHYIFQEDLLEGTEGIFTEVACRKLPAPTPDSMSGKDTVIKSALNPTFTAAQDPPPSSAMPTHRNQMLCRPTVQRDDLLHGALLTEGVQ